MCIQFCVIGVMMRCSAINICLVDNFVLIGLQQHSCCNKQMIDRSVQVWSVSSVTPASRIGSGFCLFLQVLYRLKEKVQISDRQLKAPPPPDRHLTPTVPPDPVQRSKGTQVDTHLNTCTDLYRVRWGLIDWWFLCFQAVTSGSMVQAELPPAVATHTPQQQPIIACRRLAPPVVPLPRWVSWQGWSVPLNSLGCLTYRSGLSIILTYLKEVYKKSFFN